jgi:hypothetical protein
MPRYRTIKPEFWTSDQVLNCSRDARLLLIGIWNFANDKGVIINSPRSIKSKIFPAEDDITLLVIKSMIDELIYNKLIMPFERNGYHFLYITGWKMHQKIDRPTPVNQNEFDPDIDLIEEFMYSMNDRRTLDEESTSTRRTLDTERKKEESRIEENRIERNTIVASLPVEQVRPECRKKKSSLIVTDPDILDVFNFWVQHMGKDPDIMLSPKRLKSIKWSLGNYGKQKCLDAIIGCGKSPFNMGQDPKYLGQMQNDIEMILRNAEKVERFLGFFKSSQTKAKTHDELVLESIQEFLGNK